MTENAQRDWVPADLEAAIVDLDRYYADLSADAAERLLDQLIADHERLMDRDCLNLYAGTNIMNPKAARLQATTIGSRPSLGYPGDKYEMGMGHVEKLEVMAVALLKKLFGCRFVEYRVGSGSLANLYAFMATTKPGDTIMALPDAAAGHVTHHAAGAAGYYGLHIEEIPFDGTAMAIDLESLKKEVARLSPKLIIVAGSMNLFPHPVADVRAIADRVGAKVLYDAAHMSGLIAGGAFQDPLAEGAHLMTLSTYKSFGGPAGGLVLTNEANLAKRLDKIAFPGLTANFDLGKTAALIIATLDMLEHGRAYADAMIANAQALAGAIENAGLDVVRVPGRGATVSQHVALPAQAHGGGHRACRKMEAANILASGIGLPGATVDGDFNGIRLGTQEITRWGMSPADMGPIAAFMTDMLLNRRTTDAVKSDVVDFRQDFQDLHFVR